MLKRLFCYLNQYFDTDYEEKTMLKFINDIELSPQDKILDVGCGYGRNIKLIKDECAWRDVEGIEVNQHIVDVNRKQGFVCYTPDEFKELNRKYDCMIFSHIIEHFTPSELKSFLESYLSKLNNGGHVIIATPILWEGFYWDFDHIKMYHPIGINMVFGHNDAQVQYYSPHQLVLENIWFRKIPYMIHYKRGLYVKSFWSRIWLVIGLGYKIIFKLSFGMIGKTTGWMALYRKIDKIKTLE